MASWRVLRDPLLSHAPGAVIRMGDRVSCADAVAQAVQAVGDFPVAIACRWRWMLRQLPNNLLSRHPAILFVRSVTNSHASGPSARLSLLICTGVHAPVDSRRVKCRSLRPIWAARALWVRLWAAS